MTPPLRSVPLERFFHPRVVAVIGASGNRKHPANLLYRTVKRKVEGEGGVVHPVNPNRDDIEGVPCFRSILDVPGELDLVVIASGDPVTALEEAVPRHPTFVMMFAAGFAEAGDEGARQQERIRELVTTNGIFLLGPNTTLNSFLPLRDDLSGRKIALISHSGHQGRHLWQGQDIGIPMAYWAPTGNEVDLEYADFVRFFADQPEVGAIAGYIEGFKSGATVIRSADHALRRETPLVLVKVGRTAIGESTSLSHTAHLAGSDAVTSAVFRQYGITRVDAIDELLHTTAFLARTPPPIAGGVCLYSISGGTLAHLSDLVAARGLPQPDLTPETQKALRAWIPDHLRVSNPVDSGGAPSGDERGVPILETIVADPGVGVVVVPFVANAYHLSDAMARDVITVARSSVKPICVIWGSPTGDEAVYRELLVPSGLPVFRTFGQCLSALDGYFSYHARRAEYLSTVDEIAIAGRPERAAAVLPEGAAVLSETESKAVLAAYGIAVTDDRLVRSRAEARRAFTAAGGPVVMKIASRDIAHKSDLGLVRVGVAGAGAAEAAYGELMERAGSAAPAAAVDGVIVTPLVAGGVECVIGMTRDAVFGPVVMFGLGGVQVETVADVTFRVPPFSATDARAMVDEIRGRARLDGGRGEPAGDIDALVGAILALQQLVLDAGDRLAEVDVNPLVVRADGVIALDALVATR